MRQFPNSERQDFLRLAEAKAAETKASKANYLAARGVTYTPATDVASGKLTINWSEVLTTEANGKQAASGNKIAYRVALTKMADDGETEEIVYLSDYKTAATRYRKSDDDTGLPNEIKLKTVGLKVKAYKKFFTKKNTGAKKMVTVKTS